MFPREERRADSAARARAETLLTDEQRDERTAAMAGFPIRHYWRSERMLADDWLALMSETDPTDHETATIPALARQYRRVTGHDLTMDVAESYSDASDHY